MEIDNYSAKIEYDKENNDPEKVLESSAKAAGSLKRMDDDGLKQVSVHGFKTFLSKVEDSSVLIRLSIRSEFGTANIRGRIDAEMAAVISEFLRVSRIEIIKLIQIGRMTTREDLRGTATAIQSAARRTSINAIGVYADRSIADIANRVIEVQNSTKLLTDRESLSIRTSINREEWIQIPKRTVITDESWREMVVQRVDRESSVRQVLTVKKPDLLGNSMWDVMFNGRRISAVMDDLDFLVRFHNRTTRPIQSGDGLLADMEILSSIGFESEIVKNSYYIKRVHDIIPGVGSNDQQSVF